MKKKTGREVLLSARDGQVAKKEKKSGLVVEEKGHGGQPKWGQLIRSIGRH